MLTYFQMLRENSSQHLANTIMLYNQLIQLRFQAYLERGEIITPFSVVYRHTQLIAKRI